MEEMLSDRSTFFLLIRLCKVHHHELHKALEKIGLYRGQPRLLHRLWKKDGLTQTELCQLLSLRPATVAKMVKRMENSGFVEKRQDSEDGRISRIFLSEKGKDIRRQVVQIESNVEKKLLQGFSLEERLLLNRFLIQMRDNLWENNLPAKKGEDLK